MKSGSRVIYRGSDVLAWLEARRIETGDRLRRSRPSRMNSKPARQLRRRRLALQSFKRDLRLERWMMLFAFRHL
jgi:hypothetical protein